MLAPLHGCTGEGSSDSSSSLENSAQHLPTGRLATGPLKGLLLGQVCSPGLEFRAATEMSAVGRSGSHSCLSFPHTGEPGKAFPPTLMPLLPGWPVRQWGGWRGAGHPAQPGPPVKKAPLGFPSWPQANQHREPRQAIPLNHREQKEGVVSQGYLAPGLFQPSGSSLFRFLTPCSDFQKPRHWPLGHPGPFRVMTGPAMRRTVPGGLGAQGCHSAGPDELRNSTRTQQ